MSYIFFTLIILIVFLLRFLLEFFLNKKGSEAPTIRVKMDKASQLPGPVAISKKKLPWVRIIFLCLTIIVYGILQRWGNAVFVILDKYFNLPALFFSLNLSLERGLEYVKLLLWMLLTLLALSVLNVFLIIIFTHGRRLGERISGKWRRHKSLINRHLVEENFSTNTKKVETFVNEGEKEPLLSLFKTNGISAQWLNSYQDKTYSILILRTLTFAIFALIFFTLPMRDHRIMALYDLSGTIIAIIALLAVGFLVGTLFAVYIVNPFFRHINRKARRQLIFYWTTKE